MAGHGSRRGGGRGGARLTRRGFIRAGIAAGAGLVASKLAFVRNVRAADDVNVALVGAGRQGRVLLTSTVKIPGVRFKAVCDIWSYSQVYSSKLLEKYHEPVRVYEDHREMLDKEKGIDAVLIATPDWVHAPQTVDCLEAGLHVYCETEMSDTPEGCRAMVRAARKTGRLLQIGRQRRSNPRYLRAQNRVAAENLLGRITRCYGQWNGPRPRGYDIPQKWAIDDAALQKHGYDTMERFQNWRLYKRFSAGPMADVGSHQVDVFSWFLGCDPRSVVASGGVDHVKDREWYDNIAAIYEYATPTGAVRAIYQITDTTTYGGHCEVVMGEKATLQISEDPKIGMLFREPSAGPLEWIEDRERELRPGEVIMEVRRPPAGVADDEVAEELRRTAQIAGARPHQLHLENFFDAVRGKTKPACPAEVAYRTAVAALRTNDAISSGERIVLSGKDYDV